MSVAANDDGRGGGKRPTDAGSKRLGGVVRNATRRLNIAGRGIPDPAVGEARNGVLPAMWRQHGEFGVPDDCPVQPLGMDGDTLYCIDALGQLAAVAPSGFGINLAQRLFAGRAGYLWWAWPRIGQKGMITGLELNSLRDDLYATAARKGLWNAVEKVRGLGAWRGKSGELILHCGEFLSIAGKLAGTGEVDGYFYPRRPTTFTPWPDAIDHDLNPAPLLFQALKTWNWARPKIDPLLMLGWMAAGFLGGALNWRPSMFLVGDKAVGKSTLQALVKTVFGPAIISTPDTTPAGIYQRIGNDALPVAVDELEAEADDRRVRAVVRLARLAASGGLMLRGGADHQGIEFQARSTFLFSAINAPWMPAQDLSRLAVLTIGKLDPQSVARAPLLPDAETIGQRLLRVLADGWPTFEGLYEEYRAALRGGGHDSRGQDTYGTFLACAHLALGDEGMEDAGYPIERFDWWSEALQADALPERESARDNWRRCLEHLLTSRVDAWRSGLRNTVGGLLEDVMGNVTGVANARDMLGQVDLGLLPQTNSVRTGKWLLCVPVEGPLLAKLFEGTPFGGSGGGGVWTQALRQGPADVVIYDKAVNKQRVGGFSRRCTLIVVDAFLQLAEREG
jgi:hypothetical protein